jgi:hypothetical protein
MATVESGPACTVALEIALEREVADALALIGRELAGRRPTSALLPTGFHFLATASGAEPRAVVILVDGECHGR